MPGTYLVLFFDHNADKGRTAQFRKDAREQIIARHPDIHYYEVDVDDAEFQDIVTLVSVDKTEVSHMPTFLVMTQGLGYTVHGEDSVNDIVKSLATKDWWYAHRHQRTAEQVAAETKPKTR